MSASVEAGRERIELRLEVRSEQGAEAGRARRDVHVVDPRKGCERARDRSFVADVERDPIRTLDLERREPLGVEVHDRDLRAAAVRASRDREADARRTADDHHAFVREGAHFATPIVVFTVAKVARE
jgi:hypothetical protein